jgi:hypothetical protein
MKSEILDKNRLTNIQMGMVWTLPEGTKFPDFTETTNIPDHWLKPTYVYLESGSLSGASDFLKYSGIHDTRDSWNPADYYGPGIIQALGLEPEAYQNLESVLLPELIDPESIIDPDGVTDEPWSTNIRFFGNTDFLETRIALLRLPADTWKVEFYSVSGVSKNRGNSLILSEFQTPLEVYPVLRVTYGPNPNLLNNSDDMYTEVPSGRTESVTSIEYKRQLDELRSEKILGVKFTSSGLEHVETFNISTGAWNLQKKSGQIPERHKSKYYLSKAKLADTHDIDIVMPQGKILTDPLSGVILGTSEIKTAPVRDMIFREIQPDLKELTYNPHVVYQTGDIVNYQGRDYYSEAPGNIDANPILSGLWSLVDPDYPELPGDYSTVSLYIDGPGDLQFPDTGVSMIGNGNHGYIGTTSDSVRLKIVPKSGYTLDSPNPYSFDHNRRVDNLVAEDDNTYVLRTGGLYGGYSFSFRFIPIETSVITDFRVPGYNYYTYLGNSRYRDYRVTYNSLTGTDTPRTRVLPQCQDMVVSYVMAETGSEIPGARFESIEGISLRIPSTTDLVKSGQKIRLMYHGLLDRYSLTDWNTAVLVSYHNNTSTYEVSLSRASGEVGQDGNSLWIETELLEAITHIQIDLVPKKITVTVNASEPWQTSTDGAQIHIGQGLELDLYGPEDREPVVQAEAPIEIERISSKLWKLHVIEIQVPITINIS